MNGFAFALLILVVLILALNHRMREGFSFGSIFNKVKNAVTGAVGKVVGTARGIIGGGQPKYVPTFVGRQWDGYTWSCPDNTVDTGREDYQACASSQYMYPLWRWDGKQWGWSCPNNTVETGDGTWEKKCEVGWTGRFQAGGKWQCPFETTDSGKNWENSSYHEALKQCRVSKAYTRRVQDGKKWVCPPGTKDSGLNWPNPNGGKQCYFNAG